MYINGAGVKIKDLMILQNEALQRKHISSSSSLVSLRHKNNQIIQNEETVVLI